MGVVQKFGEVVERTTPGHPVAGRRILRAGWEFQDQMFAHHPHKESYPADQYLAKIMMDTMLWPLRKPQESVIVSIFTPCEILHEAGLHPYNVEAFSCYISASFAEQMCIQKAEQSGISDTLCTYHKTFLGAAQSGLMPRPKCIVYTNLTCDANMLTFSTLQKMYDIPAFFIEVPLNAEEDSVDYVEDQLRRLPAFLEEVTGRKINEASLAQRVIRGQKTLRSFWDYQKERSSYYVPEDLVTPLYSAMTANILLGTAEEERYVRMLHEDLKSAPPAKGHRIYWMHTLPFWSDAVKKYFLFKESAQIVGNELSQISSPDYDTSDPYRAMAHRLVYNSLNGQVERRIDNGIARAKEAGADGVIWFNHWGCKHTLGASRIARKRFEDAGLPMLILDGDGCNHAHGGEGQTDTRIGAFMEMLGNR